MVIFGTILTIIICSLFGRPPHGSLWWYTVAHSRAGVPSYRICMKSMRVLRNKPWYNMESWCCPSTSARDSRWPGDTDNPSTSLWGLWWIGSQDEHCRWREGDCWYGTGNEYGRWLGAMLLPCLTGLSYITTGDQLDSLSNEYSLVEGRCFCHGLQCPVGWTNRRPNLFMPIQQGLTDLGGTGQGHLALYLRGRASSALWLRKEVTAACTVEYKSLRVSLTVVATVLTACDKAPQTCLP